MTKRLHIALLALLGLSVLAACRQANPEEPSGEVQQVTEGPVKVSLDLSLKGFGQDNTPTKGEFYDPANDFIEVEDSLFYDHEKLVKTARIYFFDAKDAFDGNPLKFNPEKATFIKNEVHEYAETLDRGRGRIGTKIELVLDKPYESLAVIVLANYGPLETVLTGSNMKNVVDQLSNASNAMQFDPDWDYTVNGIPMHGWKVFGSLEGLPSTASEDVKAKRRLRYYKGMTTPLTVIGFENPARLEEYAKETTGEGVVNTVDHVEMNYALARLQLRYVPKPKAIQADSVVIKSVKLNVYKDHIRMLPLNWFGWSDPANRPNPYTYPETAHDPLTEVGAFKTAAPNDVTFKKIDSKTGKSTAFVAYVPEILAPDVKYAIDHVTDFKEPSLKVEVEVTFRPKEKPYGPLHDKATYTYERNKITVKYGSEEKEYENYGDEGWLSWLKFRTIQEREDTGGSPVSIGTRFSLVRHYSYEWVAVGVNE